MSYESSNVETSTSKANDFVDTRLASSLEVTTAAGNGTSIEHAYSDGMTLDSKGQVTPQSKSHSDFNHGVHASMNKTLLNRASELLRSLMDEGDPVRTEIDFQSLRGTVLSLWETAANASVFHQEILSILESAILSIDVPVKDQLGVFKEAVADLEADPITQAHVDVIRAQFIKRGFNPLAVLDGVDDING